jgi:hypothetical protein
MTEVNEQELESVDESAEELTDEALDRAELPSLCSSFICRQ